MNGRKTTFIASNWLTGSLLLLALAGTPGALVADSAPPPAAEFREPDATKEQQRLVTIGIYLLIAITTGTVSFLILLMLWGARVRRQARKPLPSTTPNDPLWYLKTKKHAKSEPDGQSNLPDDGKEGPENFSDDRTTE